MVNVPSPHEELALLDRELAWLDTRRTHLLARRAWLLGVVRGPMVGAMAEAAGPVAGPARAWAAGGPPGAGGGGGETSPRGVRDVLLTLGGVLLAVAAVAFTVVGWGRLGVGGRTAVLAVVTAGALGSPVLLLRRGLRATAEAVGAVGLVLTVLDAYALRQVTDLEVGALGYAAAASAVLAAGWAGYGAALGALRAPLPAAVAAAQLPLPLFAATVDPRPLTVAWALLTTAAVNTGLALAGRLPMAVRVAACAGACATGGWAVLLAGGYAVVGAGAEPGALLLAAGGLALAGAWRALWGRTGWAVPAGVLLVAGAGVLLRLVAPQGWAVAAWLPPALALAAVAVRGGLPRAVARGLCWAAAGVQALLVGVWALPLVAAGLTGLGAQVPWAAVAVLVTVAAAAAVGRSLETRLGALAVGWLALVALPSAAGLSLWAALAGWLGVVAVFLAGAVRPGWPRYGVRVEEPVPGGAAPWWAPRTPEWVLGTAALALAVGAALVAVWAAVPSQVGAVVALTALTALTGLFAGAAMLQGPGGRQSVAAGVAVLAAAGAVAAGARAAELPAHLTGLALLLVPAATAGVGALLRRRPVAVVVEAVGAGVAVVALGCAATEGAALALALGLAGVVAAATAVRPERRPVAGYAAAALLVAAVWVRLAVWGVSVPEAYTLPVAVPALAVGALRRRRDPAASSWAAYGPGLALGLLPGLVAVWGEGGALRPLLLGAATLAVTLAGARLRLVAPLVLGGAVLALTALHELAPYVVQAVGVLPRWVPPALAGALLLAVGATYERRLGEVRRMRQALRRMG
ncbi:hypothetical protein [Streptomyces sp. NPDC046887]|uniref:SCO7613 C-terminal domain-containing membrane protein n=1 Tax=Streptomyces sp. NPDC046887 TaxID=3155472 RepID=UPI0033FBEBF6